MRLKKINASKGELLAEEYFNKHFGIHLQKIPETKTETPDYLAIKEDKKIFICEVKDTTDPDHHYLEENLSEPMDKAYFRKQRKHSEWMERSMRTRIRAGISKAETQLKDYSGLPKVCIFINFDLADKEDFKKQIDERRFHGIDEGIIDLFVWIDVLGNDMEGLKLYPKFIITTKEEKLVNFFHDLFNN